MFDRRELLRRGFALGLAPALLPRGRTCGGSRGRAAASAGASRSGRTGLELPDIGFGSSALSGDEALVRHALARGITYFDTAEDYRGGSSEETLGRALAGTRRGAAREQAERRRAREARASSSRRWSRACAGCVPNASTSISTTP